jgi:hypothetical protein
MSHEEVPSLSVPELSDGDIPQPPPPVTSIFTNIEWVTNVHPDVRVTSFASHEKELLKTLYGDAIRMCRDWIDPVYIKKAFKKFHHGILLNDHESGRRLGFCLLKIKERNHTNNISSVSIPYAKQMIVILVCARTDDLKVGPVLMYEIDKYAAANDVNSIELEAANEQLIPVYERYGYKTIGHPEIYIYQDGRSIILMNKFVKPIKIVRRKDSKRSTRKGTYRSRRRWTHSRKPLYEPGYHF